MQHISLADNDPDQLNISKSALQIVECQNRLVRRSILEKLRKENNQYVDMNIRINITIGLFVLAFIIILSVHTNLQSDYKEIYQQRIIRSNAKIRQVQIQGIINSNKKQLNFPITLQQKPLAHSQQLLQSSFKMDEKQIQQNSPNAQSSQLPIQQRKVDQINRIQKQPQRYASVINLNDFTIDPVYINAPEEMKSIFDEMIARPSNLKAKNRVSRIFIPSQKAYFAYNLYLHPDNVNYAKAEYYYYDQKYGIGKYNEQMKICVVAPGRNIVEKERYKRFIDSINRQNYSNYKLVYIDDASDDGSAEALEKYIAQTDGSLNRQGRLKIIKNEKRLYALANRNNAIRNHCDRDAVIADVDADDSLIGKQVFKFLNAIYQDKEVWQFNSVFIYMEPRKKQITTGPQEGVSQNLLKTNRYRGSMEWKTSELRTFKAELFNKIDEKDFKNQQDQFYKWASDVFIQQPLVQLAGYKHYKHLFEIVYFYDWTFNIKTVYKRRHFRDIAWLQTPYYPLQSLSDPAKKEQNYRASEDMKKEYEKNIRKAQQQANKYHLQLQN